MGKGDYVKKEEYDKLKEQNERLKRKLKKLDSRLNSIIKINDNTFKAIFNKNTSLEKNLHRFDRILQHSDRQGKSILIQKDEQEQTMVTQAKMASMGEMIDTIAHQWRQPLNNISMMVQTVTLKYIQDKLDDSIMDKFKNDTLKQLRYMSDTIDDFRSFLKEDKNLRYFNLNNTLKKIELLSKNIVFLNKIDMFITSEDIELYGIENELIQVFMNLISNSNDAFEKKQDKKVIMIDTVIGESDILIIFKDNAGGIKNDILKKIFEAKFTTKGDIGGTGVGLHISKIIVENTFKGSLEVQNETLLYQGEQYSGAAFFITLPKNPQNLL